MKELNEDLVSEKKREKQDGGRNLFFVISTTVFNLQFFWNE